MTAAASLRDQARAIFHDALAACSVEQAFLAKLRPVEGKQHAYTLRGGVDESLAEIDLSGVARVIAIAAGKGAGTMFEGLLRGLRLPEQCELSGVLVAPQQPEELPAGVEYFAGGHPFPTRESFAAAEAVLALLRRAAAQSSAVPTFCFFLISGGASAMLELPLDSSISFEDTVAFHRALVHGGAAIAEINCVRKHFSAVKGGRLGALAAGVPNLTVLVSDVPAGQLDALASGPTLPDRSTLAECREILARYDLLRQFPAPVRRFFASDELAETPKPGSFAARRVTLLSEEDLAEAARRRAEALGFTAVIDNHCDDWDYLAAAEYLVAHLRQLRGEHAKVCLISAGEVTVRVAPEATGTGGRNQHFALHAATLLEPSDGAVAILSAGSDGIDGNSPFAGAVLDYETLTGTACTPSEALAHFNSAAFLSPIHATIETGPTGNNLRDLRLLLAE